MTTRSLHDFLQHLQRSLQSQRDAALPDAHLLERWIDSGDRSAFELLLWRHGPMVLNVCRRTLYRSEDVEDAFQATFLVLVRKARSIRRGQSLAAWLHRVASRLALRTRTANARRRSREQPLGEVAIAGVQTDDAETRDLRAIVDEEIDRLPASYRRAVILCCLQGKSQEEAARLLSCPRGTLSSWLTRGRQRLRQRLLRRGVDLSVAALMAALTPDAPAALLAPFVAPLLGVAAGGGVPAGMMSAQTIALAEGMLRTMLLTKVKIAAAVLLLGGLFASGIGTLSHATKAADPQKEPRETKKTADNWNDWKVGLRLSQKGDIAWGKVAHGLRAGIAIRRGDQESYKVGESVTFVVYLLNISHKQIRLSHLETFGECMPTVEDGDGKRIDVATGPAQLGFVPIVRRILEPGELTPIGYPWFRIRPTDWQRDVSGPTCFAAPGRYKIRWAGWLRLNEDKEDVMSPATGQVELDIRQSEAPKENQPASKSPGSRAPAKTKEARVEDKARGRNSEAKIEAKGRNSKLHFIKEREVELPIQIPPTIRSTLHKVMLLGSRNRGATFSVLAEAVPADTHFDVRVPCDGVYHFIVQAEDEKGRLIPSDPARVAPTLSVCVDTKRPVVTLQAKRHGGDAFLLEWEIRDDNLDLSNMRLEYRIKRKSRWMPISFTAAPKGSVVKKLPLDGPSIVRPDGPIIVRMIVGDKAGNSTKTDLIIDP